MVRDKSWSNGGDIRFEILIYEGRFLCVAGYLFADGLSYKEMTCSESSSWTMDDPLFDYQCGGTENRKEGSQQQLSSFDLNDEMVLVVFLFPFLQIARPHLC